MATKPRLADVHCTRIQFEPGDRLLVRVRQSLDLKAYKRLHKSIQRWAGDQVEILIIDPTRVELEVDQSRRIVEL